MVYEALVVCVMFSRHLHMYIDLWCTNLVDFCHYALRVRQIPNITLQFGCKPFTIAKQLGMFIGRGRLHWIAFLLCFREPQFAAADHSWTYDTGCMVGQGGHVPASSHRLAVHMGEIFLVIRTPLR